MLFPFFLASVPKGPRKYTLFGLFPGFFYILKTFFKKGLHFCFFCVIIPPLQKGPLVKRLRHRPLTAKTWVRFPYGSPKKKRHSSECLFFFADSYRIGSSPKSKGFWAMGSHLSESRRGARSPAAKRRILPTKGRQIPVRGISPGEWLCLSHGFALPAPSGGSSLTAGKPSNIRPKGRNSRISEKSLKRVPFLFCRPVGIALGRAVFLPYGKFPVRLPHSYGGRIRNDGKYAFAFAFSAKG